MTIGGRHSEDSFDSTIWWFRKRRPSEISDRFDDAMRAFHAGDFDSVSAFVEGGTDLNFFDEDGESLLHEAARSGNVELVRLLLQQPSLDPNLQSWTGYSALSCACHEKGEEIIRLLLADPRTDPNRIDECLGYSPLQYAAQRNLRAVEVLIDHPRVDVNIRDANGNINTKKTPFLVSIEEMLFSSRSEKGAAETRRSRSAAEKLLDHPRLNTHIIFDCENEFNGDLPEGTALDKLLMYAFNATGLFDFVRSFKCAELCIPLATKLINRESERLKVNESKIACLIDHFPALKDPINQHCRPFLSDELKQQVLSPASIELVKRDRDLSTATAQKGDFMKSLKKFVERWGEPDEFDFEGLVNDDLVFF